MFRRIGQWMAEQQERAVAERAAKAEADRLAQQRAERERAERATQERQRLQRQREIRAKALAILETGKVPNISVDTNAPFRLLKSERLIVTIPNIRYLETRTRRRTEGRSAGTSVRVMKGVSMRVGASSGHSVEYEEITDRRLGYFALSNKHLFFTGERSLRIPLGKVITAQLQGEQVAITRERANSLPEYFGRFPNREDGQFLVDLIHTIPAYVTVPHGSAQLSRHHQIQSKRRAIFHAVRQPEPSEE